MNRTIKTWRDPYDAGFSPTRPKEITIEQGLTVLVGCNGAGKTTLLNNIESELKLEKIPVHKFNNLSDGGTSSWGYLFYKGDYETGISLMSSSEGELLKTNIGRQSQQYQKFFESGYFESASTGLAHALMAIRDEDGKLEKPATTERWLLFDACDSGLSIDAVIEIKALFELILADANKFGVNLFIVIVANEYELAREECCFDVNSGKYLEFTDYEDYRKFILKSRKAKEKRIEKQEVWFEKQKQKAELAKQKREEKYLPKIQAIEQKAADENRKLTTRERMQVDDYKRYIKRGEW